MSKFVAFAYQFTVVNEKLRDAVIFENPLHLTLTDFKNKFVLNDAGDRFFEWGTITFTRESETHTVNFDTDIVGVYDGNPTGPGSGMVMWRITSGTGLFAEAKGNITSNFRLDEAGCLHDHHYLLMEIPQ